MVDKDIVKHLPLLDEPLPSSWYSGYLDAGVKDKKKISIHYVFVESQEAPPKIAPVILFLNGGPGTSSMFGLFAEIGPLKLYHGVAKLLRNEYTWAKYVNLLFLDIPAPVGFSYCEDPQGYPSSCGNWNDSSVAYHNRKALDNFLFKFPDFLRNSWYFVGENYGGIYVSFSKFPAFVSCI